MFRSALRRPVGASLPALLVALALASGCDENRLGAPCTLEVGKAAPTLYYVDENAVACPSRICLLPPAQLMTDTGTLCSQDCRTDDDCGGGQSRDLGDPADKRCLTGFSCQAVIPSLPGASAPQPCRKMCVCKDFIDVSAPPPVTCS